MRYLRNNELVLSGRLFEQSITVNRLPNEAFFSLAAAAGFAGVELRDSQILPGGDAGAIRALCEKYGLNVSMLTARTGRLNDEDGFARFQEYVILAKELKCPRLKAGGNNSELLRKAATYAGAYGIRIGINNHIGTEWETPEGTLRMLETVNHPNFYCHFDPSHWWLAQAKWDEAVLSGLLPKIDYFILQDYMESAAFPITGRRRVRMCSVEETGCAGYPATAAMLEKLKYSGPVALVALRGATINADAINGFIIRSLS